MTKKSTAKKEKNKKILKQVLGFFALFIGLEMVLFNTEYLYVTMPIASVLLLIYIAWLVKFKVWKANSLNKILLPILFCASTLAFLILIPSPFIAHLYSVTVSLVFILLVRNISRRNKSNAVVDGFRVNDSALLVCAFLIFSSLYAFYIFFYLQSWILVAGLALLVMTMIYQYFWQERYLNERTWLFIPVLGLVFAELGWALTFWPTSFITRGVILFMFFYCFLGMVKLYFNDRLVMATARKYLIVSTLVLAFVLATTQWYY